MSFGLHAFAIPSKKEDNVEQFIGKATAPVVTYELYVTDSFMVSGCGKVPNIFNRFMQRLVFGFQYTILRNERD